MPRDSHILNEIDKHVPRAWNAVPITRVYCAWLSCKTPVYTKEHVAELVWEARQYHDRVLKPQGLHWYRKNPYRDIGTVLTMNKSITRRTQGKQCSLDLQKGDALILATPALTFKTVQQMVDVIKGWVNRGVGVHVPCFGLDTTTELGEWALRLIEAMEGFRWERWQIAYPNYSLGKTPKWKPLQRD